MSQPSAGSGSELLRILVVLGVLAFVGYLGFRTYSSSSDRQGSNSDQASVARLEPNAQTHSLDFDTPLGPGGKEVPFAVANGILKGYGVELAATGQVSPEHITASYIDPFGQVGLRLDTEILLIFSPDSRTSDQFADAAAELIALGEWEGSMISVRGVRAQAGEKSENWSASLSWIEGTARIDMYGDGGQQLSELIPVAEEIRDMRRTGG